MSTTVLQPRNTKVGGWLIVLILGLAFGTPGVAQSNIEEMQRLFAPYVDRVPSLSTALQVYAYLQWGVALLSIYCAYVLAFRKPAAVIVAKRGFIFMAVFQIAANLSIPLLASPRVFATMEPQVLTEWVVSALLGPLVFLGICDTYLVRSRRVKDTYHIGPAYTPVLTDNEGYELLGEATKLERKGHVQEALTAYQHIADTYSHTAAGYDALKSIEGLRATIT
jgi:hypothetical protein